MSETVWDTIAKQTAERIGDSLFEAHRGVTVSRYANVVAAFGNDGYQQEARAKAEVEALREFVQSHGGTVLGFGTTKDGYSWVLLFRPGKSSPDEVTNVLWEAWEGPDFSPLAAVFRQCQSQIAESRILDDLLESYPKDIIHLN